MNRFEPALPPARAEHASSSEEPVAPAADPAFVAKATKAAIEFESFFVAHMLHQMRAGTREMAAEDSVFKDPVNRDMQDMADNMVARQMAGQRAFGIADAILRQLLPAPLNIPK
jgi:flagellar protein FlgJ